MITMKANINKDTQLCMSLSGRPGNFGTRFHNFLYQEMGLNFVYKAFSTTDLEGAIHGIRALGIRGCAVSMPFKEHCMHYLDAIDRSAAEISSVNTIVNSDGILCGYNTDYIAVASLLQSHGISKDLSFAVRGSGGMAKAVVCALRDAGFEQGTILARNELTGRALASHYGYHWQAELGDLRPGLLINATPIGMDGGDESADLPYSKAVIEAADCIFDVVALPPQTPFIQLAQSLGKPVITGTEVMVLQAVEQFVLYTDERPSAELIERATDCARQA